MDKKDGERATWAYYLVDIHIRPTHRIFGGCKMYNTQRRNKILEDQYHIIWLFVL